MEELGADELIELAELLDHARGLYDKLVAVPLGDLEARRDVWSEIVEVQDRVTVLLPPAINPL
jgi:hypothetical protein